MERANCSISDTFHAYANASRPPHAVSHSPSSPATTRRQAALADDLTLFFIDRGVHPRLPFKLPPPEDDSTVALQDADNGVTGEGAQAARR